MIDWYLKCKTLLASLNEKALDALDHHAIGEPVAAKTISGYMRTDFQQLHKLWNSRYPGEDFGQLLRHIGFGERDDFESIYRKDLPRIVLKLDKLLENYANTLPIKIMTQYIAEERITEISEIENANFDTRKLICLLHELNDAYSFNRILTVGILVRAIIDHVPPIFGFSSFAEVVNNYRGTKSFKAAMTRLQESLRSSADAFLHVQIRQRESLPTIIQVDFRAELDALLSEVSRNLQNI